MLGGCGWDVEMRRWEGRCRWKMMRVSSSVAGLTEAGRSSSRWGGPWVFQEPLSTDLDSHSTVDDRDQTKAVGWARENLCPKQ